MSEPIKTNEVSNLDHSTLSTEDAVNEALIMRIENYAVSLQALDIENPLENFNIKNGLNILSARDALQAELNDLSYLESETMVVISELDQCLYDKRSILLDKIDLAQWRYTVSPPESSWWWYLLPLVKTHGWDQFDWVWNLLSIIFLAGFAALMIQILPIMSGNGISIFESFSLVGPGAMVTVVGSNLRGGINKDKFTRNISKLGIPSHLCSEVTCLIAGLLFGGAFIARQYLPNYYFQIAIQTGEKYYRDSQLLDAEASFKYALKIPDQKRPAIAKVHNNLGLVYESVGQNDEALNSYTLAIQMGDNQALNNMGRVYIAKEDLKMAETYLKMGLQRTKNLPEPVDYLLKYKLHRNLGWTYLEQKRYPEAEKELKTAVEIAFKYLPDDTVGNGIASCFLGNLYDVTERSQESEPYWQRCRTLAKPETIAEYSVIVKLKPSIAEFIPTNNIF
ncbi:MAG: tetratricopeptide repeat protein [Pseudanabaena sp. ELA607]